MGTQADTSRVAVRFIDELYDDTGAARVGGAWGTVPAAALREMAITGESLKHDKKTVRSARIRSDRQPGKNRRVGVSGQGDINWELSADAQFIALIAGAMLDLGTGWYAPNVVTGSSDITFSASGKTITSAGTPSFNTKFEVGQYIRVQGTVSNGTNAAPKYFKITAVTATVITVAETVADEADTSAKITGSMIRNGVTEHSFTIEKQATDLTTVFIAYKGMEVNQFDLNAVAEQIITGRFGFLGKTGVSAAATVGTGAATAAGNYDEMTAAVDLGTIMEGGTALATALKSISMSMNNNLAPKPAIGSVPAIGIRKGTVGITGRVEAYFENLSLYSKFEAHTLSSLHWRMLDEDGAGYFVTLPAVQFATDDVAAPAKDQDFMETIGFECDVDPTTNCMIQVDRFPAIS